MKKVIKYRSELTGQEITLTVSEELTEWAKNHPTSPRLEAMKEKLRGLKEQIDQLTASDSTAA